jgi:hypothetical protein
MIPKLAAFDLDGTLLTSDKKLSSANLHALLDMRERGMVVALASGRLGSSVMQFNSTLGFDPALLTLNGAAVFLPGQDGYRQVYAANLGQTYVEYLLRYAAGKDFILNFYVDGELWTHRTDANKHWVDVYYGQTRTTYHFADSHAALSGRSPSKIIFVGDAAQLDEEERKFRAMWDSEIYIVRTWDYYLEFLDTRANKGCGLTALAKACGIDMSEVISFGDADNDIPMLRSAGLGIAMKNASASAKAAAARVSDWTNDEDGVAREWERIKGSGA